MPLRDHFHSPVNDKHRWDAVHGGWPMEIVRTLFDLLPPGFVAEPKVYHPAPFEVDVATIEDDHRDPHENTPSGAGVATLLAPAPTLTVPIDFSLLDEYEVLIYDDNRERTLVAAIEIVSPANKDRPDTREQFMGKVSSFLRRDVCVVVVDIVTTRQANLYAEFLASLERTDPALVPEPPALYAVTLRSRKPPKKKSPKKEPPLLDVWFFPLAIGQPLPTVPLWLGPELHITLPLEPSYSEVCRLLRIA
jgi:hypothetical protein